MQNAVKKINKMNRSENYTDKILIELQEYMVRPHIYLNLFIEFCYMRQDSEEDVFFRNVVRIINVRKKSAYY